jgi:hypothetical protein
MCGRYTHKLSWKQIVELYRLTMPEEPPENFRGESYNPFWPESSARVDSAYRPPPLLK